MRKVDGCSDGPFFSDMEDEEILFLWMQWEDTATLERYIRSGSGSAILGAIDLLGETVRSVSFRRGK